MPRPPPTAAVKAYWNLLVRFGCVVRPQDIDFIIPCGSGAEIAHCHDGSIVQRMQEPKAKGWQLPRYDWLALPLCPRHHRLPGPDHFALDYGVLQWEHVYGTQAQYLDWLVLRTGIDVWAKAQDGRK